MGSTDDSGRARQRRLRADAAARSVTAGFGHRLLGLPGTFIGSPQVCPSPADPRPSVRWSFPRAQALRELIVEPWHYWWQAHFLDCLLDAGWREYDGERGVEYDGVLAEGQPDERACAEVQPEGTPAAAHWHRLGAQLFRTIKLRNGNRWVNDFYDDMAWLGLAGGRLSALTNALAPSDPAADRNAGRYARAHRNSRAVLAALLPQLESAATADLGGGLFWSTKRDFKNAPATAPAALVLARNERPADAQRLIDWLNRYLLDPETGLYFDGIRRSGTGTAVERVLYSYNQGPALGALMELGGAANLRRAEALIAAVERHFLRSTSAGPALRTHRGGDGGLFTGILARYLALAANAPELSAAARSSVAAMVHGTAEALWAGGDHRRGSIIFSSDPAEAAAIAYPSGAAVELSTQLQAWMVLEASAAVR